MFQTLLSEPLHRGEIERYVPPIESFSEKKRMQEGECEQTEEQITAEIASGELMHSAGYA